MNQIITKPTSTHQAISVGMDVHKRTIYIAALSGREWLFERTFSTENLADLRKALLKLAKKAPVQACYEASGAGFRLHRLLTDWGISCEVIAPSLIPTKPGEKKKCDRLDARKLAEYFDRGLLTKIHIPTAEEEADRNLIRCRFSLRRDVTRSKHRVVKFLDCQGHHYSGTAWTQAHRLWLEKQEFPTKPNSLAFRSYLDQLVSNEARLKEIDAHILELSQTSRYCDQVKVLRGFRGVDTLTAMVFLTELGDLSRFPSPHQLMAYLGLIPKVHQSGDSGNRSKGITKSGNSNVRHVLIQSAWKYCTRHTTGYTLLQKQKELPAWAVEQASKAQKRLYKRCQHLSETRGRCIAIPAVARELACFLAHAILTLKVKGLPAPAETI